MDSECRFTYILGSHETRQLQGESKEIPPLYGKGGMHMWTRMEGCVDNHIWSPSVSVLCRHNSHSPHLQDIFILHPIMKSAPSLEFCHPDQSQVYIKLLKGSGSDAEPLVKFHKIHGIDIVTMWLAEVWMVSKWLIEEWKLGKSLWETRKKVSHLNIDRKIEIDAWSYLNDRNSI